MHVDRQMGFQLGKAPDPVWRCRVAVNVIERIFRASNDPLIRFDARGTACIELDVRPEFLKEEFLNSLLVLFWNFVSSAEPPNSDFSLRFVHQISPDFF